MSLSWKYEAADLCDHNTSIVRILDEEHCNMEIITQNWLAVQRMQ